MNQRKVVTKYSHVEVISKQTNIKNLSVVHTKPDYYEFAFLSAFANMPSNKRAPIEFIEAINSSIFEENRKILEGNATKYGQASSLGNKALIPIHVYKPRAFVLFGDFDLAVFSLIDDFAFASRRFKPNSKTGTFKYQINTGVIPLIKSENLELIKGFKQRLENQFLSEDLKYPYLGICSLKIDSSLIVGVGNSVFEIIKSGIVKLVDEFIVENSIGSDINEGLENLFFLINENLGWNEITIYFFSKNPEPIKDVVFRLRQSKISDLIDRNNEHHSEIYKLIQEKSLYALFVNSGNSDVNGPLEEDLFSVRPFIATTTVYGIDSRIFEPEKLQRLIDCESEVLKKIREKESLRKFLNSSFLQSTTSRFINLEWNVRPGYEFRFLSAFGNAYNVGSKIDTLEKYEEIEVDRSIESIWKEELIQLAKKAGHINLELAPLLKSGRYTLVFPNCSITILEYIKIVRDVIISENSFDDISHSFVKLKSTIKFYRNNSIQETIDAPMKLELENYYDRLKIHHLTKISEGLKNLPVSNLIEEELENIIINFNEAISDPLLSNYFIGLRSSIIQILKKFDYFENRKIEFLEDEWSDFSVDEEIFVKDTIQLQTESFPLPFLVNHQTILEFINTWDQAYWNRYYHSYYFADLGDNSIEHHGGVQQILFSYDSAYKIICESIYGSKHQFATIVTDPFVKSNIFGVKLNLLHLFSPIVFASECIHEAANHYLNHLGSHGSSTLKAFLKKIIPNDWSSISSEDLGKSNQFIDKLKRKLILEDSRILDFFDKHFGINILRYLVTDFITYDLGYSKVPISDEIRSRGNERKLAQSMFLHSFWLSAVSKTSHFEVLKVEGVEWNFKSEVFDFLFIRCNLMLLVFEECTEDELREQNERCPSFILERYWRERKEILMKFVIDLAKKLSLVIANDYLDGQQDFFLQIKKNLNFKNGTSASFLDELLTLNSRLMRVYFNKLNLNRYENTNIVIREYQSKDASMSKFSTTPIIFDPRGYTLIIDQKARRDILKINVYYMKTLYDIAQRWILNEYKDVIKN